MSHSGGEWAEGKEGKDHGSDTRPHRFAGDGMKIVIQHTSKTINKLLGWVHSC